MTNLNDKIVAYSDVLIGYNPVHSDPFREIVAKIVSNCFVFHEKMDYNVLDSSHQYLVEGPVQ